MKVTVFGVGYVGLTAGVCFAEMGNDVLCMDIDKEKIDLLKQKISPIHEPGLDELLKRNIDNKRLSFTTNLNDALTFSDIIFIALGTPSLENGNLDLRPIEELVTTISAQSDSSKIIVVKSTVPPGTCNQLSLIANSNSKYEFDVASNPEFMKEGSAINDFLKPDRIIIGTNSQSAMSVLKDIYAPFNRSSFRIIQMDVVSSELTKFAANAMLATRISFMNELSRLCEKIDANIESVREGIASDERIGNKFLYAGCGYGGSCFPKDVGGLIKLYEANDIEPRIPYATHLINEDQKNLMIAKVENYYNPIDLKTKNIAILGLSFKPETDDLREAPSLHFIKGISDKVNKISAYDPLSIRNQKYIESQGIEIKDNIYSCCENADAVILFTEWKEFRSMDFLKLSNLMNEKVMFDGRNMFKRDKMEALGWQYINIGEKIKNER